MKKIISLLMVLVVLLCMAVPVGAEEGNTRTVYLKPKYVADDDTWQIVLDDNESTRIDMVLGEDGIFYAEIPEDAVIELFFGDYYRIYMSDTTGTGNLCEMDAYIDGDYEWYEHYTGIWKNYDPDSDGSIFSVTIEWGEMIFSYSEGTYGTWNPETLCYEDAAELGWSWEEDSNRITVENEGDSDLNAVFGFESNETIEIAGEFRTESAAGAGETLDNNTLTVAAGQSESAYFHIIDGVLTAEDMGDNESLAVGTLTVTLAEAEIDSGAAHGEIIAAEILEDEINETENFTIVLEFDALDDPESITAQVKLEDGRILSVNDTASWTYDLTNHTATISIIGESENDAFDVYYRNHENADWIWFDSVKIALLFDLPW